MPKGGGIGHRAWGMEHIILRLREDMAQIWVGFVILMEWFWGRFLHRGIDKCTKIGARRKV